MQTTFELYLCYINIVLVTTYLKYVLVEDIIYLCFF